MFPLSKLYPVHEIFDSIQGEGVWTGIPATFIRLQGCNLRCPWCDTKDTWSGASKDMTPSDILSKIHFEHVIITGGEPLLHDLTDLLERLDTANKKIHIETNGTQPWKESYPTDAWITVSPKMESDYSIHSSLQARVNEYKFVVDDAFNPDRVADYLSYKSQIIYLSPENVRPEMVKKAIDIVYKYPHCRLMVQVHKLIGVE
jgi:organic radical activating enzyme